MKLKRFLSVFLALVMVFALLPAVSAPALAATEISSVSITLDAPAVGARPDYTAAFPSGAHYYSDAYDMNYFRNDIRWEDVTDGTIYMDPDSDVFRAGHIYRVWVYLTAEEGYEFSDEATAMLNAETVNKDMSGSQLFFYYTFLPLPEEGYIATGSSGEGVYWKLDEAGTLTYYGNGVVNDSASSADWGSYTIKNIVVDKGITKYISGFTDMTHPAGITVKGHLTYFYVGYEKSSIYGSKVDDIFFLGDAPDSIDFWINFDLTIWYDPDMSGWTEELLYQLSQDSNITVKASGSPVVSGHQDLGFGEGSPAVTFSVTAEGKGTLSYQWYTREPGSSNWIAAAEASGKTADYTFIPTQALDLYCRVSNALGSADSQVMYLKKVIFSQPADQTVNAGEEASFSVQAGGMNGIYYQWYYLEPGSSEWVEVSENGTSATYTLTADGSFNGWQFRCKVNGSTVDGSGFWHTYPAYSSAAALTVISASKPTITTQPKAKTVAAGAKATFKVVASGEGLSYQWQYRTSGSSTWKNKTGATSASYTVTAKESYDGIQYRCKVSNAAGTVTSKAATLTVTAAKPVITTQPTDKSVAAGATAKFTVVATGEGLTYQWQYKTSGSSTWKDKSGATSASYTVTAKESYNGIQYRCKVSNAGGSVTSTAATLTVTLPKPEITTQPKAQTAAAGETATFKVVASGTGLTYQWQYSTDYGKTWHDKAGSTKATHTVTVKASYNGYLYRCKVTNSAGTVTSSKVRLTVSGVKPKILSQPAAASATAGESVTFKVVAAGVGMTYQWQYSTNGGTSWKNKTGATSASYTVTAKESYNGILYRC
ncbi:MAG: hypothetical protein J5633_08040, partial [Oscillospiraceae bacterium]|nr:hypothetical protein [Oscillospiraceae bacterium]